ncbi:MAG: hypothetical protein EOM37_02440 [Proteobacteria bacterium]|jgi:hypothetical protein|nr:hypothetical protein [Alphaproteobacteria bacterium]NCC02895.1 hypothetical protein [Pseudomonadota bacterium]
MSSKKVTTTLVLPPAHFLIGHGATNELTHVEGVLPLKNKGRHTILSLVQGEGKDRFFGVAYMDSKSNTRHCFDFLRDFFGVRRGPEMTLSVFSNRPHPFDLCPYSKAFGDLNVVSASTQVGEGAWRVDLNKGTISVVNFHRVAPQEMLSPNEREVLKRKVFHEGPRMMFGSVARSLIKEFNAMRCEMQQRGSLTEDNRQTQRDWLAQNIDLIRTYSFPEPFRLVADLRNKEKFKNYKRTLYNKG